MRERWTGLRPGTRVLAFVGAAFLLLVVGAAVFADALAAHPPDRASGAPYERPSADHLLGTDDLGRDLWAQLVFGARVSLFVGLLAAVIATVVGTAAALVAGWRGGWVDALVMRVVDLALSLPFLVLVLVLAAYFGRGLQVLVLLIAGVLWARPARLLRGQVLKVREFGHVVAADAMGAGPVRILGVHVLRRLVPLLISQFVRAAAVAVIVQSGVAFLGLGDPGRVSWGSTLYFANNGSAILTDAWLWWVVPPGVALTILIVGLAFAGFALEEWAEPQLVGHGWRPPVRRRLDDHPSPEPPPGAALAIRGLTVDFDGVEVVRDVDLTVGRGRMLGLVGGSGSGKSTLALAVMGLIPHPGRIHGGSVHLGDVDLRRLGRQGLQQVRGREVALVPQAAMSVLDPTRTILRQVAESSALGGQPDPDAHAATLLARVGLPADRHGAFPHELSGGQRQRVVIAMAVANRPKLVIADEPTTGLDVVTQHQILDLLDELRSELGMDLWLISHDLPMLASRVDDLAVMDAGRIVETGPAGDVLGGPTHTRTTSLLGVVPSLIGDPSEVRHQGGAPDREIDAVAALELSDANVTFGSRRGQPEVAALRGVSLRVERGERVALVGRSGAGKSTVARLAAGLVPLDSGSLVVLGEDLSKASPRRTRGVRRRTQTVFQDPYGSLHPGMRVGDLVAEPLAIAGLPRSERWAAAASALDDLGLQPADHFLDRHPGSLSGGQRQRVAIARTLVARPELILADEPASMLDASLRATVADQLLEVRSRLGATLVFITHDLALARHVADRVVVLLDGRIVEDGPVDRVLGDPTHEETKALLAASHDLAVGRR